MILFNGSILSANIDDVESNIIKFQQLNIDLRNLQTDTITSPKLQETSTIELIKCLTGKTQGISFICKESSKKEIITMLNRRLVLPFYIPIISLLCSFLLIQNKKRSKNFINQYSVFCAELFSFIICRTFNSLYRNFKDFKSNFYDHTAISYRRNIFNFNGKNF